MLIVVMIAGVLASGGVRLTHDSLDVQLVTDEADSAVALASRVAQGSVLSRSDLERLTHTNGFEHLQEREARFGGALSDSAVEEFVRGLARSGQSAAYRAELQKLETIDVKEAARGASAYLPKGTALRARMYLEIKPRPNSFVFRGADSVPSIFLAVQPGKTPAQAMNTLTHELHHIGVAAACRGVRYVDSTRVAPAVATLLEYLTAFGEGRAMLAAAGGPHVHPHAVDDDSIRLRWDRDVRHAPHDVRELSAFARAVLDGGITSADSVTKRGNSYFGVQGPWYTVGWLMASTVERVLGRRALVATTCDPVALLVAYNEAVSRAGAREGLPSWPASLIARLKRVSVGTI
jgi:hypothetical protein